MGAMLTRGGLTMVNSMYRFDWVKGIDRCLKR